VEVLQARPGLHVWQLVLPALAQVVRAQPGPVVLVGAPFEPFGPALAAQGLPGERLLWVRA
jgi:protein ImuA